MKIIESNHSQSRKVSIAKAIEDTIDTSMSDGQIERVQDKVQEGAELIGKLVQALYENGHLTNAQIADMINYRYTIEE